MKEAQRSDYVGRTMTIRYQERGKVEFLSQAARAEGLSLEGWARQTLLKAARRVIRREALSQGKN